ncbi:MAG: MazG family protein [Gammaproteobacteria bacterium]|nr:MazG family protein [Gammaproteobacteria bacterium]
MRKRIGDQVTASILDGVASALPALLRAVKLQRRAAAVGFDWAEMGAVHDAVRGELDEVRAALAVGEPTHIAEEIGDLLFACVNLARFARVDPESALRSANQKFERRFRYIEQRLEAQGQSVNDATLAEMDALWEDAKRAPQEKRGRQRRPRRPKGGGTVEQTCAELKKAQWMP